MVGGLAATPIDRVPEVVAASSRASLGGSPGSLVVPPFPSGPPIVNSFPGISSPAGTSPGVPIGSRWPPLAPGATRPRSLRFPARLLGKQRLDLLLGLALALKELG